MKISKQEEYGLRCILHLARFGYGKAISVSDIAAREGLSADYVTKLLVIFRKSGLIASARGIHGGYALKRPADQIRLSDVLRPMGGFFYPKDLCSEYTGKLQECSHIGNCGIRPVWTMIAQQIYSTLNRTTLADLLMEEKEAERRVSARPQAPVAVGASN